MLKKIFFFRKPTPVNYLEILPPEICQRIGAFLQPEDLLSLMLANKALYQIYLDEYFLRTNQAFLYRVRNYNAQASRLKTEEKEIANQTIQRTQSQFRVFERKIKSELGTLQYVSDGDSVYRDCLELANEITHEDPDPVLYYQSSGDRERFLLTILFFLSTSFVIYFIRRLVQHDVAKGEAETFWRSEAETYDCCLGRRLKNMTEDCQKIYTGYHDQKKLIIGSIMGSEQMDIICILLFIFTLFFSMIVCHGVLFDYSSLNKKVLMRDSIKELKKQHRTSLQNIAVKFPDLLGAKSIEVLVEVLMDIYRKQPSITISSSLYLKGQRLLQRLSGMRISKARVFSFEVNQQFTLFGRECVQFEAECKAAMPRHAPGM